MVDYSSSSDSSAPALKTLQRRRKSHFFPTQQQFLDSLRPIAAESLEENNRKCGYCWRNYGEPNPGEDDAEKPVQFMCKHVFGEQCMRSLFAIKEPARVDLKPLSFEPGSKGEDLGTHLTSYVESRGVQKSALLTGGNRQKDFVQLLKEALPLDRSSEYNAVGPELLGKYWYGMYYEMIQTLDKKPDNIHLLENAIVFDIQTPRLEGVAILPHSCGDGKNPMTSKLNSFLPPPMPPMPPMPPIVGNPYMASSTHSYAWPAIQDGDSTVSDSSISDAPATTGPPKPKPDIIAQAYLEKMKMMKGDPHVEDEVKYWKDVMQSQSKLDTLIKKHKENQAKEAGAKTKESKAQKQDPMPEFHYPQSNIASPAKATFAQPPKKKTPIVESEDELTQVLKQKKLVKTKMEKMEQISKEREMRHRHIMERLAQSFAEAYVAFERYQYEQAIAAGRPPPIKKLRLSDKKPHLLDDLPPSLSTTPPSPNAPVSSKTSLSAKVANPKKYPYSKAGLGPKAPVDPKAAGSLTIAEKIDKAFTSPYSSGPPSHSLLTSLMTSMPTPVPSLPQPIIRPRTIRLVAELHDRDKDAKVIQVNPPTISIFDVDSDDEDGESDGVIDAEKARAVFADKTILLWRTTCAVCFKGGPSGGFIGVPEQVWWKVNRRGPDDCPKCRQQLFMRG